MGSWYFQGSFQKEGKARNFLIDQSNRQIREFTKTTLKPELSFVRDPYSM